jgi:hypothetical protein
MSHRKSKRVIRRVSYRLPKDVKDALVKESAKSCRTETAALIIAIRLAYAEHFPKEG